MCYLKYFTVHVFMILETFFIILEVLLLCRNRNYFDTGRKNYSTGKKNYSTWHLICRLKKIPKSVFLYFSVVFIAYFLVFAFWGHVNLWIIKWIVLITVFWSIFFFIFYFQNQSKKIKKLLRLFDESPPPAPWMFFEINCLNIFYLDVYILN